MQIGVAIRHHDHDYIERRGGHVFFSHLRGAPGRVRYRKHALVRAEGLYDRTVANSRPPEEICGAGMIVLQRAVLATEDIASLLHALAEDDPESAGGLSSSAGLEIWPRLVRTTIADQRAVFENIARAPDRVPRAFRLPPNAVLEREYASSSVREGVFALRDRTADRWAQMLARVAQFWLQYGDAAKATMHGFTAIAGRQVVEPPGAGVIDRHVRPPSGPFVVMVNSTASAANVHTPITVIEMIPQRVKDFRRSGTLAAKLTQELSAGLASGIDTGHAYGIPPLLAGRLNASQQAALASIDGRDEAQP